MHGDLEDEVEDDDEYDDDVEAALREASGEEDADGIPLTAQAPEPSDFDEFAGYPAEQAPLSVRAAAPASDGLQPLGSGVASAPTLALDRKQALADASDAEEAEKEESSKPQEISVDPTPAPEPFIILSPAPEPATAPQPQLQPQEEAQQQRSAEAPVPPSDSCTEATGGAGSCGDCMVRAMVAADSVARAKIGLNALQCSETVSQAALAWSEEMCRYGAASPAAAASHHA